MRRFYRTDAKAFGLNYLPETSGLIRPNYTI